MECGTTYLVVILNISTHFCFMEKLGCCALGRKKICEWGVSVSLTKPQVSANKTPDLLLIVFLISLLVYAFDPFFSPIS
jgi:hypothetical protein